MAFDRHRIWREVALVNDHLEENPRDGFTSGVRVWLAGRPDPIKATVVETRRDPDYPWLKIYRGDEDGGYVFTHEHLIDRIEVGYVPLASGLLPGFRAEVADDPE
jgi:hypothetical protein